MPKPPPVSVDIEDATTELARLLARVEQGEEIVIARAGHPVARLVPFERPPSKRSLGRYAGLGFIADDFDAPLPPGILDSSDS